MGCPAGRIPGAEGDVRIKNLVKESAVAMGERIFKKGEQALYQLNWIGSIPHSQRTIQEGVDVRIPSMDLKNLRSHSWM
eukprot:579831-Pelagomonas_calceolata.AAC.1